MTEPLDVIHFETRNAQRTTEKSASMDPTSIVYLFFFTSLSRLYVSTRFIYLYTYDAYIYKYCPYSCIYKYTTNITYYQIFLLFSFLSLCRPPLSVTSAKRVILFWNGDAIKPRGLRRSARKRFYFDVYSSVVAVAFFVGCCYC